MCVNKEHHKCCCCSLTTATIIFGVFTGLGCIGYAAQSMWINFSLQLAMTLIYVMVCVRPHDVIWRKMLYYLSLTGWILSAVVFLAVSIILLSSNEYMQQLCQYAVDAQSAYDTQDSTGYSIDYDTCVSSAKTAIIIVLVVGLLIQSLFAFIILQVLYYGWKEQEQKSNKDNEYHSAH